MGDSFGQVTNIFLRVHRRPPGTNGYASSLSVDVTPVHLAPIEPGMAPSLMPAVSPVVAQPVAATHILDGIQTGFEVAGLIPGIGEIFDLANAAIYLARGDYANAAMSAASMVPFAGQAIAGAKLAAKAGVFAAKVAPALGTLGTLGRSGGKTGGRLGNAATRKQIDDIATTLESRGYTIVGGGGRVGEEYLKPLGKTRRGSSFPDITATHPNYPTLRINTVDVYKNGLPTRRELRNAARIRKQIAPGEHLLLIPKR